MRERGQMERQKSPKLRRRGSIPCAPVKRKKGRAQLFLSQSGLYKRRSIKGKSAGLVYIWRPSPNGSGVRLWRGRRGFDPRRSPVNLEKVFFGKERCYGKRLSLYKSSRLSFGRAACRSGQGPVKPPPLCLQVRVLPRPSRSFVFVVVCGL